MKEIYRDDFTGSIAISCDELQVAAINYFATVKEAIAWYPDAIVHPSLQEESTLKVSVNYNEDLVTVEVNNQVLRLSLFQAQQLKSIL